MKWQVHYHYLHQPQAGRSPWYDRPPNDLIVLEKAFDRVQQDVLWWALRKIGIELWMVTVITVSHMGSTISMKLIVLSWEYRVGLPLDRCEHLVFMEESQQKLIEQIKCWNGVSTVEIKWLKVSIAPNSWNVKLDSVRKKNMVIGLVECPTNEIRTSYFCCNVCIYTITKFIKIIVAL